MRLKKRDLIFLAGIALVLGIFLTISGEGTTVRVPLDATHRPFYDLRAEGQKKIDIDPLCAECHDGIQIPFPADHPAKPGDAPMRCLFCHKLQTQ